MAKIVLLWAVRIIKVPFASRQKAQKNFTRLLLACARKIKGPADAKIIIEPAEIGLAKDNKISFPKVLKPWVSSKVPCPKKIKKTKCA